MYLSLGMVSLGLGILGIPLPILPTTLFLLLAIACFTRSSKRFEKWLYNTKLYQTYVADFRETKSIAKETMAIGDEENDRAMLEVVGSPVVMENGNPEIKKIAKYITKSNDESGVAYAIRKWVLD